MISQTAEYALRAIVAIAGRKDQPVLTAQIAEATSIPSAYLAKVLQMLGRQRLVVSQRGLGGGFSLAIPAEEMTVLDVISAVDSLKRIVACPLGFEEHEGDLCPLHKRLDEALAMVEQAFACTTIAELLGGSGRSAPLCEASE